MKKIIFICVFVVLMNLCNFSYAFINTDVYINFAMGGGSNITAVSKNAEVVEKADKKAWQIPIESFYYINCNVDNSHIYDISCESLISVTYFDDAYGKFTLQYSDAEGNIKYAETVVLRGSETWKTHCFNLYDCAFNDGVLGEDFRITLQDENGRSASPVSFSGVEVVMKYVNISCAKTANMFLSDEQLEFNLLINNDYKLDRIYKVRANVYDDKGKSVWADEFQFNMSAGEKFTQTIFPDEQENGIYTADFEVIYDGVSYTQSIKFAVCINPGQNIEDSIFGACTHLQGGEEVRDRVDNVTYMLKHSGIDWIRDEYYWEYTEPEKGEYHFWTDGYIDRSVDNGINPLVILDYGNSFYGGTPHDEEGYEGFANYAKALAEHLKDKVKTYEIWNEFNGAWSGGYGVQEYAYMLKYAYEALKSVDEDITVVAGATIMASTDWFDELFSITIDGKSVYEYCDVISYHPYCYPNTPDAIIQAGNIENNASDMYNMMLKYGEPKPQWITEIGWFTGSSDKCVSEELQADYIARTYISGMAYGVERIFWYDFMDDGNNATEPENNYGTINSYKDEEEVKCLPKQSYLSTAAAAHFLKGTEFVKEYRPRENIRIYKFQNIEENREIHVMYTADDKEIDFILTGDNHRLNAYDNFGNKCYIKSLSGSPVYIEGEIGEFDVTKIITETRTHAISIFGDTIKNDGISVVGIKKPTKAGLRNAYTISADDNILCDIDDSWIYSNLADIKILVDYYDKGRGDFWLEYKKSDGTVAKTDIVTLNNSSKYKTAEFIIEDFCSDNSFNAADFSIVTDSTEEISLIAVKAREINSGTPILVGEFDGSEFMKLNDENYPDKVRFDGFTMVPGANPYGEFKYVEREGRGGVYVPNLNDGRFLGVEIDDDILFGGLNDVTVRVDYFDEGYGNFDIAFDYGDYGFLHPTQNVVYLQNTKTWKTAEFTLGSICCGNCWFENHCGDFRVALWTGWMPTGTEGIIFGGIRIKDNTQSENFNISYDEQTQAVKIYGYFSADEDNDQPVTVQILNIGVEVSDLSEVTAQNTNEYIRHFEQIPTEQFYEYKYFEKEFKMDSATGVYLVRVRLPGEEKILERYFNYYNLYDIDNLVIKDKDGNVIDENQLKGVDYLDLKMDFQSNYDNTDVIMMAAIYDEEGRMCAVEMAEEFAVAGDNNELKTEISLSSEIEHGYTIKIFMLKNMSAIIPFSKANIISVK